LVLRGVFMFRKSLVVFCLSLFLSCGGGGGGGSSSAIFSSPWKGTKYLGVRTSGGTSDGNVTSDKSGNVFVTGSAHRRLDGNTTGISDFFVVKYDSSGERKWTKQLGVAGQITNPNGIATDSAGNVYVTGVTGGGLDGKKLTGTADLFLTKFNSSGEKLWTQLLGFAGQYTSGYGITPDSAGNFSVVGCTHGGSEENSPTGYSGCFVAKYNSSGEKQWVKQLGVANNIISGSAITSDSSGNIYVTGITTGGLDENTQTGIYDFFVIKFDSNGNKKWSRQLGVAGGHTQGFAITSDPSSNVYVSGNTTSGLDGNLSIGNNNGCFLTKYNSLGEKQGTWDCGGISGDGITSDPSGNVYVTGPFDGNLDGSLPTGKSGCFVTKYNSKGEKQGTWDCEGFSGVEITTDPSGNIFVMGTTFGGSVGNKEEGIFDSFIIKFNSSGEKQ
jgi:hypothetical protein